MEQLKNLLADVAFTDKDRVIEILEAEGIDDLETLRAASEDDLRKASLKMGDIIKIRMLLENQISRSSKELDSSRSSISSAEDDQNLNDTKKDDKSSEVIKVKDVNAQGIDNDTSYNAQAMLQKCLPRTKCTIGQTYFRNLLRDCAREARIWQKAYTIPSIPDVKLHKFFELVFAAAPQLAGHKAEVKRRLGQALQNRRKYESDIKAGKRTTKKKRSPSKEKKDVAHTSNSIEKTIVGFLQKQSPESTSKQKEAIEISADDDDHHDKDQQLSFKYGDDVILFKEKEKKSKLAKAIYLGPRNSSTDKNETCMYSMVQLKTKMFAPDGDDIQLPEETSDGDTTLNTLTEKTIFTWKTSKLGPADGSSHGPPKKKTKTKKTMDSKKQDDEYKDSSLEEIEDLESTTAALMTSTPIKAHDSGSLRVDLWVAVAYNEDFYVGQITSMCGDDGINVNFLTKRKDGTYKWPRQKDTDLVSTKYIFCSCPRVQKVGSSFVVHNEESVTNLYNSYKKKYLLC